MRKVPVVRDPKKYAHAVELGSSHNNIPPRPLFGKTLQEYRSVFVNKIDKVRKAILDVWK